MIKFENRYDEYAYRVATRDLDPSVTEINEGQWVTINDDGKIVISDGTRKSFMAISSKRAGRDNITMSGKCTYLFGHFEVTTDQFDDAQAYGVLTPLVVNASGKLTPYTPPTYTVDATSSNTSEPVNVTGDTPDQIVAYSLGAPVDGFLRILAI